MSSFIKPKLQNFQAGLYPNFKQESTLKGVPSRNSEKLETKIAGLYPKGSPSRNSRRPRLNPGLRGGLEIVFNQQ
ncbi:uncharacterized protein LOC114170437 [Vigna unguiculata]|uniref:uncharacterized protein LOC114170437 n=1 Tax=Vigna unguiculata TaxID=3917 RepID=UPI001017054F|nr:uncharacterized protein LOC114170437 [Vigna unguiculata]